METGCVFDNHRGIYMGEAIIGLAQSYGFILQCEEDGTPEGEFYCEAIGDAENFLNNNVAEKGYMYGYGECGDFMYMPVEWFSDEEFDDEEFELEDEDGAHRAWYNANEN